jgi:aquaporin TIP
VALAHGLAIGVMVTATGHISGGHFNPAVTFGALVGRQISPGLAVVYWIAQLLGGLSGALTLWAIFPVTAWQGSSLGTPALGNGVSVETGILVEAVLTFFLVFVVYGAAIDPKGAFRPIGSLAIGLTITMDILMGGTLTGAAMNPARWFGPAIVANAFDHWYVWWVGPFIGGGLAGAVYAYVLFDRRR